MALFVSYKIEALVIVLKRGVLNIDVQGTQLPGIVMITNHPHSVVLLSSRFQYPGRRLFFTRARLFFDRIELTGWQFGKKHTCAIPLDAVDTIEWQTNTADAVLHLTEGGPVMLRLAQADQWKQSLDQRLHWNTTNYFPTKAPSTTRPDLSLHDLITFSSCMG